VANDISIIGQASLSTSINQLYTNIYKANDPSDETFATQTTCWESVPSPVTKSINQGLVKEIVLKEVN
jgi:hypothetical protein